MKRLIEKNRRRVKRKKSIRGKIKGTPERPRLSVFKSNRSIYIQAIDDISGTTLMSVSNLEKEMKEIKSTVEGAAKLGTIAGERLKEKKIETIVFDRNGFLYHGRIQAVADGIRKAGLKF